MSELVQKFLESNIKKTWDNCEYDLDNPTDKFYYDLKTSLDTLEHKQRPEHEPNDFMKTVLVDKSNHQTDCHNTDEIMIKNPEDADKIDSLVKKFFSEHK